MFSPRRLGFAASGIKVTSYNYVSKNRKYLVHGSSFSIYIYTIPDMTLVQTFCQGQDEFRFLRLNPTKDDELLAATNKRKVHLFDLKTNTSQEIPVKLSTYLQWVEYSCDGRYVYFLYKDLPTFVILDLNDMSTKSHSFGISTPRLFAPIPGEPHKAFLSTEGDVFEVIDFETGKKTNSGIITSPFAVKFDPLNEANILIITKLKKWAYILGTTTAKIITTCDRTDIQMVAGDWIPSMPGHILTGDKDKGILYVWSISSGQMVSSQSIGTAGITNILLISNKDYVITSSDGSLGVYDIANKSYEVKVQRAHLETIFFASFLPSDPSVLATAGADGRVCFWQLPSMKQQTSINISDQDDPLYCVSFSNGGGYIATGSQHGYVTIRSIKTNQIVYQNKTHKAVVFSVEWSPHDPNIIASSGTDNVAVIANITTKENLVKISVKHEFRRLKWSQKTPTLAIACGDGSIYVRLDGGTYFIIKGSKAPLFDVAWSPFDDNIIAATDDVGNVIVFDIQTKTSKMALGHSGKARPIAWSPTIKNLLISGGYDGALVFWDARTLKPIKKSVVHSSHIYGIAMHPLLPTIFATASRDTTVRLWSLDQMFPAHKIDALLKGEKFVAAKYNQYNGANSLEKLIHRISKDGTKIAFRDDELIHLHDILKISKKRLSKMINSLPNDQSLYERGRNSKKQAIDAAHLALKSGNTKKFCELMFICGETDIALAIAPQVSYNFWQSLVLAKAQVLKGTEEAAEYYLIAGKPKDAIHELMDQECYDTALLIAASMREKNYQPKSKTEFVKHESNDESIPFITDDFTPKFYPTYSIASKRSIMYAKHGEILLSAASLLTVGDVNGALSRLIHNGEIAWAIDLARATNRFDSGMAELLFKYCVQNGKGEEAFQLLSSHQKRELVSLIKFSTETERNDFYSRNGLKTIAEYLNEAKRARGLALAQFRMLSGRIDEGIVSTITYIKKLMDAQPYDFFQVNQAVNYIRNAATQVNPSRKEWIEAVAICHYFGVYHAMWKGYWQVIRTVADAFQKCAELSEDEWLTSKIQEVQIVVALCLAKSNQNEASKYAQSKQLEEIDAVKKAINYKGKKVDGGITIMSMNPGSVPIDIEVNLTKSICSNLPPSGNVFYLEDGVSIMSSDEALMYFEVTPFSPLPTCKSFIPY